MYTYTHIYMLIIIIRTWMKGNFHMDFYYRKVRKVEILFEVKHEEFFRNLF